MKLVKGIDEYGDMKQGKDGKRVVEETDYRGRRIGAGGGGGGRERERERERERVYHFSVVSIRSALHTD
jgi:hypothetical protein